MLEFIQELQYMNIVQSSSGGIWGSGAVFSLSGGNR